MTEEQKEDVAEEAKTLFVAKDWTENKTYEVRCQYDQDTGKITEQEIELKMV